MSMMLFTSCIKQEQKQNAEGEIVDLLNQNKSDEAISKIDEAMKTNPSDELYYLKASSLSMKAGIDIYALFPLLKVKIFDVAISQWSQNREFQKKINAQRSDMGLNADDVPGAADIKDSYKPMDITKLKYIILSKWLNSQYDQSRGYCEVSITASNKAKISENYIWINYRLESEELCKEVWNKQTLEITPEIDEAIKKEFVEADKRDWFVRKKKANEKQTYVKVLGTFWTVVDMIPMLVKIPKISTEGFQQLVEAQKLLITIKQNHPEKTDELGIKAKKQLMMLSALKIVGRLQNALVFNDIKSPTDLVCKSNERAAEELIMSEQDALYLISAIDDPEILKKNQELFDNVKKTYSTLVQEQEDHPEIKDARIQQFGEEITKYKEANCL